MNDKLFLEHAIQLAKKAESLGEVPVGSIVVSDNDVIGEGWNCPISENDPSAHAEIIAIRAAAKKMNNYRLPDTTLYVTLEPCTMCVGAIIHARLERVVYAAADPKTGADGGRFDLLRSQRHNQTPKPRDVHN